MSSTDDTFKSTLEISQAVDRVLREKGFGDRGKQYQQMLNGINTQTSLPMVSMNRDRAGFTFFTRPCLNLTYSNLTRVRELVPFRDGEEYSLLRWARVTLDPWSQNKALGIGLDKMGSTHYRNRTMRHEDYNQAYRLQDTQFTPGNMCDTPLVDPFNPFIPALSNNLLSLSGWPDATLDFHTSEKGIYGEEHIQAQGIIEKWGSFSLEGSFRNTEGNPLILLMMLWQKYMSSVLTNEMMPYPIKIAMREIDYMTRIYRFVMDQSNTYITMWANCGAGFPVNNPFASIFNFERDKTLNDPSNTLNYSFQCIGAEYNKPIVLEEFNRLMAIYNPQLAVIGHSDDQLHNVIAGKANYFKLRPHEKAQFNYQAYPLINEITNELEWWVPKSVYNTVKGIKQ